MAKRPKFDLIPRWERGKPKSERNAAPQKVPPPKPMPHPVKTPTQNRRGR